jgi:hypothetical protein
MNMRNQATLYFLLIHVFTLPLIAQSPVWEGQSEALLHFDPNCAGNSQVEAIPLKVVQPKAAKASRTPFRDALIQMIRSGKWAAYANSSQRPLPHERAMQLFVKVDTIITFDPETYEESLNIVETDLLEDCQRFWLRLKWKYYASGKIGCRAVALSPYLLDYTGQPQKPRIWFELPPAKARFNDPTHRRVKYATLLHYDTPEQRMQHNTGSWTSFQRTFIEDFKAGRFTGYTAERAPIPLADAAQIFNATDTIYTIDPEKYTEKFEVVEREYRPEDIRALRVEQAWYLEPRNGRLQCELLRLAPAISVVDEYGTLRFYQPMFFWKQ